jgi:WD40 repeat protein
VIDLKLVDEIWLPTEHEGRVLDWSIDGKALFIGTMQGRLLQYLLDVGEFKSLDLDIDGVETLTISPDGEFIAINSENSGLQVLMTSDLKRVGHYPDLIPYSSPWSKSGNYIVCDAMNGSSIVFSASDWSIFRETKWEDQSETCMCTCWVVSDVSFAEIHFGGIIGVRNVASGEVISSFSVGMKDAHKIEWSDAHGLFLIAGTDGICAVNMAGTRLWHNEISSRSISLLNDDLVAVSLEEAGVAIFSVADGHFVARAASAGGATNCAKVSRDRTRLASVHEDGSVRIWDSTVICGGADEPSRPINRLKDYAARQAATLGRRPHNDLIEPLSGRVRLAGADPRQRLLGGFLVGAGVIAWAEPGRTIWAGDRNRNIICWDVANGAALVRIPNPTRGTGRRLDLAVDPSTGTVAVSYFASNDIWLFRDDGQFITSVDVGAGVSCLAFSPTDGTLAISQGTRGIAFIKADDLRVGASDLARPGAHLAIAWSPEGDRLALGSETVSWDGVACRSLYALGHGQSHGRCVAWHPDGRLFAVARSFSDGRVDFIDAATGDRVGGFRSNVGEPNYDYGMAWSPDGRLLAVCGSDLSLYSQDGEPVLTLPGGAASVLWAPCGTALVVGHGDGNVRVWEVGDLAAVSTTAGAGSSPGPRPPPVEPDPTEIRAVQACAALAELGLPAPLALVRDLICLLGNQAVDGYGPLQATRGFRLLAGLKFPPDARAGLIALLVNPDAFAAWTPPANETIEVIEQALLRALMQPQGEEEPFAPRLQSLVDAAERVGEPLAALLRLAGPELVERDPGLPLRLAKAAARAPRAAIPDRTILATRLTRREDGRAIATSPLGERAGLGRRGKPNDLMPGQLALPDEVFQLRVFREELSYRVKRAAEPPILPPCLIILDVSPAMFDGPENIIRPAAYILAASLMQQDSPAALMLAGGASRIMPLASPADLMAIWTERSFQPVDADLVFARAARAERWLSQPSAQTRTVIFSHTAFAAEARTAPPRNAVGAFAAMAGAAKRPLIADLLKKQIVLTERHSPAVVARMISELIA